MKALKQYQRTFECVGYVQYAVNEEIGQDPKDQRLPALVSYVDGKLATLRIGMDAEDVQHNPECLTYRLYEPKDQQRLADSDITEIHFEIPAHIDVNRWRKDRAKTKPNL